MGTSASSSGPGSGVPLVPPWVDNVDPETGPDSDHENNEEPDEQQPSSPVIPAPIALPGRFRDTRSSLGRYAESGDSKNLKNGLRHYSRTGLGGAKTASTRMKRTAINSGALYSTLSALREGSATISDHGIDLDTLQGRSARDVANKIANVISPNDGTQDSEANQRAISQALTELVAENPDANLTSLSEDNIIMVIESYICNDICQRIELDVGKHIFDKAGSPAVAMQRLDEISRYVKQCVSVAFRKINDGGQTMTRDNATKVASSIIENTFIIFEEYIE